MNDTENPFQSPAETAQPATKPAINWRAFWQLNIGLVVALAAFILVSLAWTEYDLMQRQQLPRRYATYDHEYHVNPIAGLLFLFSIFAATNLVFFSVQLLNKLSGLPSPNSSD